MTDEYDEMAKKLLPCQLLPGCTLRDDTGHNMWCAWWQP
mgnify:FL=1